MTTWDTIENLNLIENGLLHLCFELSRESPSYFRTARESHLLRYRSMVEALKGSANLAVTGRPPKRSYMYQRGGNPWQEIHKVPIEGCQKAWRFSEPKVCKKPPAEGTRGTAEPQDYLIGFYDTLAMIQTECFMGQFVHSAVVPVCDEDMKTLEWLHEEIRNEYEHFIPKSYTAPVQDLLAAAELCLHLTRKLLFDSENVLFHAISRRTLEGSFKEISERLLAGKQPGS